MYFTQIPVSYMLLHWIRRYRWILFAATTATLLHIIANLVSRDGLFLPAAWRAYQTYVEDTDMPFSPSNAIRVSLCAHSIAWILHTPLWIFACGQTRGMRRGLLSLGLLEVFLFPAIPTLLLEAKHGFAGPVIFRNEMDPFLTASPVVNIWSTYLAAPVLFIISYIRALPTKDIRHLVHIWRPTLVILMGCSAFLPYDFAYNNSSIIIPLEHLSAGLLALYFIHWGEMASLSNPIPSVPTE